MIPIQKNQKITSICVLFLVALFSTKTAAQTTTVIPNQDSRVITTGVPFILIASDARAAGMGDMGVATSVDTLFSAMEPFKICLFRSKIRDWD